MLSEHERRQLEAIESRLRSGDPDLVLLLTGPSSSPAPRGALRVAIGVVVLGTLGVLLALGLASAALLTLTGPVVVGGWVWLHHLHVRRSRS